VVTHDELARVFDRGLSNGVDALSPNERELFRIQDFIIEYEMGGLSGYFYNRLSAMDEIQGAVAAMRRHNFSELADLLDEAASLFTSYTEPRQNSTWGAVLQQHDPTGRLGELDKRIAMLDDYRA
jgi:hypothetical protein